MARGRCRAGAGGGGLDDKGGKRVFWKLGGPRVYAAFSSSGPCRSRGFVIGLRGAYFEDSCFVPSCKTTHSSRRDGRLSLASRLPRNISEWRHNAYRSHIARSPRARACARQGRGQGAR
eukprot:5924271-Pyramimonas_sp.AAC.1